LPTDPRWVNIVEKNRGNLTDHAWCEQKAATNAITIITNNSEHQDLVKDLLALAKKKLIILSRYNIIIKEDEVRTRTKNDYVNELYLYMRKMKWK
jgi:tRNA-(ms[2]io[6]A)-hydroxylase